MTQQYPTSAIHSPSLSERFEIWRASLPSRSRHAVIAGVCAGLAEHWHVSPTVVRLGFLAAAVLPGPMWALYILAWLLMPAPRP